MINTKQEIKNTLSELKREKSLYKRIILDTILVSAFGAIVVIFILNFISGNALKSVNREDLNESIPAVLDTIEEEKKQLRINGVRSVGLMLVGLNLIFGIFVSLVTHGEGSFQYSKGVFYLMILYVGFGFWASLTNAIRDRGIGMMWNSLRMINLSAAITGVFILIAGFYDNYILEMSTRNLVLSITGTFSFMILLLLTVHTLLLSDGEEK